MNLLAKIGSIILKVTEIVAGFAPVAEAAFPSEASKVQVVSQDLSQIASIITQIEAAGQALQLAGAQKLTAAAPLVAQVILQSSVLVNHTIASSDLFKQGSQKIADGMADVLNSLHGNVATTSKT